MRQRPNPSATAQTRKMVTVTILVCTLLGFSSAALAKLDLSQANVVTLENGLQVITLEEHSLPVVSVQAVYKVGAKNEQYGLTGISHYFEHMAFRASKNFPDTDVVSKIYAVGGEWHAYTWMDQTIYFETMPSQHLDLAMRIEADRMKRLLVPKEEVDPERGAIFSEMHSYENDPANPLRDAVTATAMQAHPYRNNVVGITSDINNIQHADLIDVYKRYYQPGNAVLVIVGDFNTKTIHKSVRQLFGKFPATKAAPLPATIEPAQLGERRINIVAASEQQNFEVAYHAPAVSSPDFVPFLMLREILGGSKGVNFQHDLGFSGARPGAYLDDRMTTWLHPTRQPFLFTISTAIEPQESQADLEKLIELQIARLRDAPVDSLALEKARYQLLKELVFDVETTEDAAHQLGFFAGLDALDVLMNLRSSIAAVDAADVQRIANQYLLPTQRTVGWSTPTAAAQKTLDANPAKELPRPAARMQRPLGKTPVSDSSSETHYLSSGMPVIVRQLELSESAYVAVVYPSTRVALDDNAAPNIALYGHTTQEFRILPAELPATIRHARQTLDRAALSDGEAGFASNDPWTRLTQAVDEIMAYDDAWPDTTVSPTLITVVGDLDVSATLAQLEEAFGDIKPTASLKEPPLVLQQKELEVGTVLPRSQGQIAYVVPAPAPSSEDYDAWRIALYVYTHAAEGRLGKKTISSSGLLYWIDSEYASDGQRGWIIASAGVDQVKQDKVKKIFLSELVRLQSEPPTEAEIEDARNYFLGRQQSAAQSNTEIGHRLIRDWLTRSEIVTTASLRKRLEAVTRADVIRILPAFTAGSIVTVNVDGQLPASASN